MRNQVLHRICTEVLNVRFAPEQGLDWDVAIMFLGSNYNESPTNFRLMLESLLDELSPRPVLLLTVTEFRQSRRSKRHHPRRRCAEHECSDS